MSACRLANIISTFNYFVIVFRGKVMKNSLLSTSILQFVAFNCLSYCRCFLDDWNFLFELNPALFDFTASENLIPLKNDTTNTMLFTRDLQSKDQKLHETLQKEHFYAGSLFVKKYALCQKCDPNT